MLFAMKSIKKFLTSLLIFALFLMSSAKADCFYDYYHCDYPPIFLRPIGNDTIIFKPQEVIRIPEEDHIQVYCYSGIENLDEEWGTHLAIQGEKLKNLTIRCNKHVIDYKVADYTKVDANTPIRCGASNANFFKNPIEYCPYDNFVFGFPLMDESVVLVELCYNFNKFDLMFFRYVATSRSPFLKHQEIYNPSNISLKLDGQHKFIFPHKIQILPSDEKINFTFYAGSTGFEFGKLIEFEKYNNIFEKFLGDTYEINNILWWSNLKNGNWKLFEELLYKEAQYNDLDVFAGKSGIVTYPHNEECTMMTELNLKVQGLSKTVPLLVWHYIRPRNNVEMDVIVIGINSPFFDFESEHNNITKICQDMCQDIAWLKPLGRTRKMSTYGYIFCCKPGQVKDILQTLDGFPNFSINYEPPAEGVSQSSDVVWSK